MFIKCISGNIFVPTTDGFRFFMTGWEHIQRLISSTVPQLEPGLATQALEWLRQMSRSSIQIWPMAFHWRSYIRSAQSTSSNCISGLRRVRWCVSIPEDAPANTKRIDSSPAIASTKISMRCHRLRPCPIARRASVSSNKSPMQRQSPSTRCPKERSVGRMSYRKKLLQKSRALRSDLRNNRIDWLDTIPVITALTEESKPATCYIHMERIYEYRNVRQTWPIERSCRGRILAQPASGCCTEVVCTLSTARSHQSSFGRTR